MNMYMCDFETVNNPTDCRVWAYAITRINGKETEELVGNNIDEFMDEIAGFGSCRLYFHNAKFDTDFIIQWLFGHGYQYNNGRKLQPGEFTCLVSDTGIFYSMKIAIFDSKTVIDIYDSYKLIPLPVAEIPAAYGIENAKGEIDYNLDRPVGWKLTQEETEYVLDDVRIVRDALKICFDEGMTKMTCAANALSFYQEMIGNKWKYWFPSDPESDIVIRQSYYGGAVMVNPIHRNKIVHNLHIYDVNSHFPAQLYHKLMPYGKPLKFEGKYQPSRWYPLYVQTVSFYCELKEGHLPCIPASRGFMRTPGEWLIDSPVQPVTYTLTNVDLEMLYKHYNVWGEVWQGGYMMRGQHGMFKQYIDFWMEKKEEAVRTKNKGLKTIAKRYLNSLYGKFGTNPLRGRKHPEIGPEGETKWINDEKEYDKPIYVAIAAFTTAYARQITIGDAQKLGDKFVYMDTDSLHCIGVTPEEAEALGMEIHESRLGAWDNEYNATLGRYLHAKCYYDWGVIDPGSGKPLPDVLKCAGMQQKQKKMVTNLRMFAEGLELGGKLVPKRYKGGTVLSETTFKIKVTKH